MRSSVILTLVFLLPAVPLSAQNFSGLDRSPLDIAYYPDNFAHDRKAGQKALVKVVYSRPYKNKRELFGGLVPYGKVWRTGANEATEITFYQDAVVAGKEIRKGTYSLFTIPEKEKWTVIFNADLDYWGAYSYDEKKDVLRVDAKPEVRESELENFSIHFAGVDDTSATMWLAWGNTVIAVPLEF